MSELHTPAPWGIGTVHQNEATGFWNCLITRNGVAFITVSGATKEECEANTRLVAAAPSYAEATAEIAEAVANNSAPVSPIAALRELDRQGKHVTLDAALVLDLMTCHAKATGGAA